MPLSLMTMRIGTIIHNLEIRLGQGAMLVRFAGTSAKILKIPSAGRCLVLLPFGSEKFMDLRFCPTIDTVSNPSHSAKKLRKLGQNRWRGWWPEVRGVAMNPIDHPHGGGEGKSKGNHPMTPWGKPTKSGYKTASPRKRNRTYTI